MTRAAPGVVLRDGAAPASSTVAGGVPLFLTDADGGGPDRARLESRQDLGPGAGTLQRAVRGFFENGGRVCHVARLATWSDTECARVLDATADVDEIDLVCAPRLVAANRPPGDVAAVGRAVLRHCHGHGGRVALLDTTPGRRTAQDVLDQRDELRRPDRPGAEVPLTHGVLLHPWLRVDGEVTVPSSGHIAGVIARCERSDGPRESPANERIAGALGLVDEPTDADAAILASAGVGCVRARPARGLRLWGSRTLDGGDLGARRVVAAVRRHATALLEELVFEPAGDALARRVVRVIEEYLGGLLARGVLSGGRAADAFGVRCDAVTTPPERALLGVLVVEVGLAVAAPAEFVTVRLALDPTGTVTAA